MTWLTITNKWTKAGHYHYLCIFFTQISNCILNTNAIHLSKWHLFYYLLITVYLTLVTCIQPNNHNNIKNMYRPMWYLYVACFAHCTNHHILCVLDWGRVGGKFWKLLWGSLLERLLLFHTKVLFKALLSFETFTHENVGELISLSLIFICRCFKPRKTLVYSHLL